MTAHCDRTTAAAARSPGAAARWYLGDNDGAA